MAERPGGGSYVDRVLGVGAGAKPGTLRSHPLAGVKDSVWSLHYPLP